MHRYCDFVIDYEAMRADSMRGCAPAAVTAALAAALSVCTTWPYPDPLDGSYELESINGQPVPFDEGPLPPRRCGPGESCEDPDTAEACRTFVDHGLLSFQPRPRRFGLYTIRRSSCGNRVLSRLWSTGRFTRRPDGELLLELSGGVRVRGRVDDDEVRVPWGSGRELSFARPPLDRREEPLRGEYGLAEVGGEALPVDRGAAGPDAGPCRAELTSGILSVGAPAADRGGRFSLGYTVRDSCTGAVLREVREFGSYDRVRRFFGFTAERGRNRSYSFPGYVDDRGFVVFRDTDWLFRRPGS